MCTLCYLGLSDYAEVLALTPHIEEYPQDYSGTFYMTRAVPETGQLIVAVFPVLDVNEVRDALAGLGNKVIIKTEKHQLVW